MLIRLLIYFIVGIVIYRVAKNLLGGNRDARNKVDGHEPVAVDDVMIQDPVCGAYFPKRKGVTLKSGGTLHHFCSERCRDLYKAPESETQ